MSAGRARALALALASPAALQACADPASSGIDGELTVAPPSVACAAGDAVALEAFLGGRRAAATFTVAGDGVWLTAVQRDRGIATVACEAEGRGTVVVEAGARRTLVPAVVAPAPAAGVQVTLAPASIALVSGTRTWIEGRAVVSRPGASAEVRYRSLDTAVVAVDSLFGLVRATGPGATTVVAEARANRRVTATASVVVVRSATLVTSIAPIPPFLTMRVGDSARVTAAIQLAATAPPGTSRALVFETTDPTVVTVSAAGVARAVGQGAASILVAPRVAPLLRARIAVGVSVPAP